MHNFLFINCHKYFQCYANPMGAHCVFCKNNNEPPETYFNHTVKDFETGITTCPILRKYTCTVRTLFFFIFKSNFNSFYSFARQLVIMVSNFDNSNNYIC